MHLAKVKGILSANNGMNLYRGCSHGCIYCDSRSRCYHMEHDFEDIEVKENALLLLEDALRRKRRKCMIGTGAMTDPYIPLEMELQHVRKALSLICDYGFGIAIQTKSDRILRDIDLLKKINDKTKAVVQMTLTTSDDILCRKIEPGVCITSRRVQVLKEMHNAGIPTVVWLSPILPYLNDTRENISGIVDACAGAGVRGVICYGMGLTLREGNREYFYDSLDRLFPGVKEKYIAQYGNRYEVMSPRQAELMELFHQKCEECGIMHSNEEIFQYMYRFEDKHAGEQLTLWDL